jgi:hypothetical protein
MRGGVWLGAIGRRRLTLVGKWGMLSSGLCEGRASLLRSRVWRSSSGAEAIESPGEFENGLASRSVKSGGRRGVPNMIFGRVASGSGEGAFRTEVAREMRAEDGKEGDIRRVSGAIIGSSSS